MDLDASSSQAGILLFRVELKFLHALSVSYAADAFLKGFHSISVCLVLIEIVQNVHATEVFCVSLLKIFYCCFLEDLFTICWCLFCFLPTAIRDRLFGPCHHK